MALLILEAWSYWLPPLITIWQPIQLITRFNGINWNNVTDVQGKAVIRIEMNPIAKSLMPQDQKLFG